MHLSFLFAFLFCWANSTYAQNDKNEQLLKKINSAKDTAKVNTLNTLAWNLRRSDPQQALSYTTEALQQSNLLDYKPGKAKAYKNISAINWISGNYGQSIKHIKIAIKLYSELKDQTEIGNMHNLSGLVYWNKGDYSQAKKNYSDALNIFISTHDTDGIAKALVNLGILYLEQGDFKSAFEHYIEAEKIKEKQDDKTFLANISTNIGIVYSKQKQYPRALIYYTKGKEINLQIGDKTGIANSYSNIGTCYFNMDNLDSSLTNHLRALSYYQTTENTKGIGETHNSIGAIYSERENPNEAIIQYEKALAIRQEIGDRKGELTTCYNLASTHLDNKIYDKALFYFKQSLSIAEEIHSTQKISLAHYALSNTYEILTDYKNAYGHYKQYSTYQDSIFNKESNDKLLALQTQYETDKKEKEIELLNKEVQLKESKSKLLYIGIGSLIIISSLIITLQVFKRKKNKKILENEIQSKEKELELNKNALSVYTKTLLEKNQLLEELNNKLKELEAEHPEDHKKIEKISQLTSSKIITEDDWERFKNLFEKVYAGFLFTLKNEYQSITTAELRLAALIKLNLDSKEISSMIGISNDSVKKTRQRLRKKLGLDSEDGLEETIYKM